VVRRPYREKRSIRKQWQNRKNLHGGTPAGDKKKTRPGVPPRAKVHGTDAMHQLDMLVRIKTTGTWCSFLYDCVLFSRSRRRPADAINPTGAWRPIYHKCESIHLSATHKLIPFAEASSPKQKQFKTYSAPHKNKAFNITFVGIIEPEF